MSRGQVRTLGSRGQPPVEPHSAPKCPQLEIPEKRYISFPEFFKESGAVEASLPLPPCLVPVSPSR